MLLLRIVVFSESVLLVVVLTPDCILPILDSINRKSTTDTKMLDSLQIQAPRESQFPFGKIVFQVPCQVYSVHPKLDWFWYTQRIWYFHRESCCCKCTTSLFDFVSGADERFIAQTQKEQFCSIFPILQTRVSPKTLLVLVLLLSKVELESLLTEGFSTSRVLVLHPSLVLVSSDPVSIHQKELTYTSLETDTQTSRFPLLLSLRNNIASGWRTYSPRYRLHTSLWYRSEHWYRDTCSSCLVVTSTKTEQVQHCYHKVLT